MARKIFWMDGNFKTCQIADSHDGEPGFCNLMQISLSQASCVSINDLFQMKRPMHVNPKAKNIE